LEDQRVEEASKLSKMSRKKKTKRELKMRIEMMSRGAETMTMRNKREERTVTGIKSRSYRSSRGSS
jgi:hypothetical protein